MNNLLSLLKNIFYTFKRPLRALYLSISLCLIPLDIFLLFFHKGALLKRLGMVALTVMIFCIPSVLKLLQVFYKHILLSMEGLKKERFKLFLFSILALRLLVGAVIPSNLIAASPQEFSFLELYESPLIYIGINLIQTFGLFVLWPLCLYFLFSQPLRASLFSVESSTFCSL